MKYAEREDALRRYIQRQRAQRKKPWEADVYQPDVRLGVRGGGGPHKSGGFNSHRYYYVPPDRGPTFQGNLEMVGYWANNNAKAMLIG